MTRPRWGPNECARLRALWLVPEHSVTAIARLLGRPPRETYRRAAALGLPLGVPPGYESLDAARRRSGYDRLRPILEAAGVPIYRMRGPRDMGRCDHGWFVDPDEVDRAVAERARLVPVRALARNLRCSAAYLRRWLREAGIRKPRGARVWLVAPDVAAPIVAARQAARRRGGPPRASRPDAQARRS